MRTRLLALVLLIAAASFVDAKKKKDLDELESLLENIDEDQDNADSTPTKKRERKASFVVVYLTMASRIVTFLSNPSSLRFSFTVLSLVSARFLKSQDGAIPSEFVSDDDNA
ncbi:unnamed protein product [Nippostrongylus brasiliensis]|uniref:RxLR effector protein n=1 Tax=Nippostrongylus brasiliensis TaxID=27835 RepID=A0A0N4YAD0_NIPBR|nr:unnamed protein product [Nippostrongylus brasiliensis]